MDNNRNVLLAIVLSFMVMIGWVYLVAEPQMEAERQRLAAQQELAQSEQQSTPGQSTPQAPGGAPAPQTAPDAAPSPAAPGPGDPAGTEPQAAADPRVPIETPSLSGSVNLKGGRIDDLLLTHYRETIDPDSPRIRLFSPLGSASPYYSEFGWVPAQGGPEVPGVDAVWTAEGDRLSPGEDLVLTWDNGAGLVFTRTLTVDAEYMFTVTQSVENNTGAPVTLYPYGLVNRHGRPRVSGFFILHEGLIGVFGEEGLDEVDYSDLDDDITVRPPKADRGWIGITDKYWASALVPIASDGFQGRFVRGDAGAVPTYQADFLADPLVVPAGGTATNETLLFAGAKEVHQIDAYEAELGIDRFELLIDWGWFYFLTKPLFYGIDWFYRLLGNFGLAILAATVVIKAVFFPLANKSYASMSKMKKLQPEMQKLQERFKDDRMALQKEMMELYKKEKVNPLAGCWPIAIQIPVFFALYKVLFVTIEMRHAPFFGWVKDLSAPDPTSIFNLFGLLPFELPQFLMIGIWPLIMGLTMFVQMRMNPTPPDKTQAMIFAWMPVIFTVMLASFPAGLVIYWAWNNFLSILQQGAIMKRHGVKIELWGNLKGIVSRKPKNTPAE